MITSVYDFALWMLLIFGLNYIDWMNFFKKPFISSPKYTNMTMGLCNFKRSGGMDVTNGILGELLRHRTRLSPDMEAVVSPSKRLTYREYNETVNRLAHFLLQNNVQKGDRVAMLCKNLYPFPVIYFAAAKIGAVTVPINWRQKTDEIRYILENCKPKILFYNDDFDQLIPLLGKFPFIQQEIRIASR
jgi:non-ribosomal peptide synthetase component F